MNTKLIPLVLLLILFFMLSLWGVILITGVDVVEVYNIVAPILGGLLIVMALFLLLNVILVTIWYGVLEK